jgi:hypothetical protein
MARRQYIWPRDPGLQRRSKSQAMLNTFLTRWRRQPAPRQDAAASTLPSGAGPHSQQRSSDSSLLQSLLRWLPGDPDPWGGASKPAATAVPRVREDFLACLAGLDNVADLERCIAAAQSMREFWHLRGRLYTAIARAHSQSEAEARLATLSAYFRHYGSAAAPAQRRH